MMWNKRIYTSGFTLIEFMVAMSIFFIISTASYIPYSHYQKKSLLNQWSKEVAQSFQEARNMSINGLDSDTGNVSVGIFFDGTDGNNLSFTYLSYPYDFSESQITYQVSWDIQEIRKKTLPEWVQIDTVWWKEKFLVFFESITWKGSYYYWDTPGSAKQPFTDQELNIDISFKGATSPSLQKEITYYTQWYIADY